MKSYQDYYKLFLYPLQDKVLEALDHANSVFYLTGGTALGRVYLNHRYSDDLDFFANNINDFKSQTELCVQALNKSISNKIEITLISERFLRLHVKDENANLKVEFVNDVTFRSGEPIKTELFGRTDSINNILSNKISALSRNEAKDISDIWQISLNHNFNWKEIISDAKQKDMWVDESEVLSLIKSFDLERLNEVKWINVIDIHEIIRDFEIIVEDILWGNNNRLVSIRK